MRHEVEVRGAVPVGAETVWETIRTGRDVNLWFPAIATCHVDGDKRTCTMQGGGELAETIVAVDDAAMRFAYRVESHPMPVGPVDASMVVTALGPDRTEVVWRAAFDGEPGPGEAVATQLRELYQAGLRGLGAYRGRAA